MLNLFYKNIGYWLTVALIMASAKANVLFDNTGTLVLLTAISWLVVYKKRIAVTRGFLAITAVFLLYSLAYLFKFNALNVTATLRFYLSVSFAYAAIRIAGANFFGNVEDIVYRLALISLPLYLLQLAAPDFAFAANNLPAKILPFLKTDNGLVNFSNSIVWTFNSYDHPYRNAGFMWEPGSFGAMLNIALLINLLQRQFKPDTRSLVLLLAMLSTLSTTAYIVAGLLVLVYFVNKGAAAGLLAPALLIPLAVGIWQLDFVGAKIEHQFNTREDVLQNEKKYHNLGIKSRSLGRFGSLVVDARDLAENPVLGNGFQYDQRTQGKLIEYTKTNGLSDYTVKFGLLGLAGFIVNVLLSFRRYRDELPYHIRGIALIPPLLMVIAFSNPVLLLPFFVALQVYYIAR